MGFSFTLKLYQIITIFFIPSLIKEIIGNSKLRAHLKYFIFEWKYLLLLGFIFSVLLPWEYNNEYRTFSQRAFGRSIISSFRIFVEICVIVMPFYWVKTKIITLKKIMEIIAYVIILSVFIAVLDYFTGYPIKTLFGLERLLEGRFSGLSGEPRSFGRAMLMANIVLSFCSKHLENKVFKMAIIATVIGIFISASSSAIISYAVIVLPLKYYFKGNKKIILVIGSLCVFLTIGLSFNLLNADLEVHNGLFSKMERILQTKEDIKHKNYSVEYEPTFFKSFEVFDRAALNFLYDNPWYSIIGTGPNLISIPSSRYIDTYSQKIYGDVINSVPHTYFINVLSRSGILGCLSIIVLFSINMNKQLKRSKCIGLREFFLQVFFVNLIISTGIYFFLIGIIITLIINKNDFNNNTNIKLS